MPSTTRDPPSADGCRPRCDPRGLRLVQHGGGVSPGPRRPQLQARGVRGSLARPPTGPGRRHGDRSQPAGRARGSRDPLAEQCATRGPGPPSHRRVSRQMASMKMFQLQFHTGFVPRNAATVKFAKCVGVPREGPGACTPAGLHTAPCSSARAVPGTETPLSWGAGPVRVRCPHAELAEPTSRRSLSRFMRTYCVQRAPLGRGAGPTPRGSPVAVRDGRRRDHDRGVTSGLPRPPGAAGLGQPAFSGAKPRLPLLLSVTQTRAQCVLEGTPWRAPETAAQHPAQSPGPGGWPGALKQGTGCPHGRGRREAKGASGFRGF